MLRCQYSLFSVFVLFALTNAFDITRMEPIADKNIHTGNRMLYEREINANISHATAAEEDAADGVLDVNEIPVRFDDAQLWRIYNISEHMQNNMPLAEMLESKFGGVIWKENSKFLDISINKENLKAARSYLTEHNIDKEVINTNIQEMIDAAELEGIKASQAEAGSRTKKQTSSGIDWKDYHDLETIYAFMREIRQKFPKICRLYSIGKSAEGRDLKVLRISENPREYKKIWIDGGIHAREWISPATVTFILYQLMIKWEEQPDYIKQRTWYIMPVMNPDGYVYSRKVNRMWRKNRARIPGSKCIGVDLNRNFNIGWKGRGSSTDPCSDIYRGASAGSELETKAVVNFLLRRKHNLEAYLTFHSYGQAIVHPWAYKAAKVKDSAALQRVGQTAVQRILSETKSVYKSGVTYQLLSVAGGGSDDWTRAACDVKYVYTVELRDTGKYGFQLPPSQILGTGKEGLIVVEAVAQAITL
ncbi:carboxypeptidase B [Bactrocera dorsalis]|uniref:Carboxypeptidase B n=1 Tax=Bactrocera dorsalis TaxID=27457 RepID=A0A6I9UVD5_BACDO|nr:carboxypeptidase B [Bactrocera dorsalis]XP_011198324.2 carboxypeptidase B [Bactrocera dorsalis]